jgi:RNA polymerase sigma-70 factor (ECF subfamily)
MTSQFIGYSLFFIAHADADDVLQNVLLKAWKGLDNFREESHLYTWLQL